MKIKTVTYGSEFSTRYFKNGSDFYADEFNQRPSILFIEWRYY
jgi:hypothetical protein